MNRRELLSTAAIVPFAPLAMGSGRSVTIPGLLERIENRFECVEGVARAYFEGVYPSGEFGRAIYISFVNGMAINDGDFTHGLQSEGLAIDSLWKTFEAYAIGKKGKLYWRGRPTLRVITPEQMMKDRGLLEVTPGRWQPAGIVEDGLTKEYAAKTPAEYGEKHTEYYARMRLVITDLLPYIEQDVAWDGAVKIDRPSGEVWQRIGKVTL